jgi:hypothetical protein
LLGFLVVHQNHEREKQQAVSAKNTTKLGTDLFPMAVFSGAGEEGNDPGRLGG